MAGLKKGKGSSKSKGGKGKESKGNVKRTSSSHQVDRNAAPCLHVLRHAAAMRHKRCDCSVIKGKAQYATWQGSSGT